jgi:Na+/melibiose symporter-like transporter
MSQPHRLSWRVKAGYSATDLGLATVETLLQIYLLKFYNVVLGLPAAYTGLALAIAIFWDAISDPIMGGISDGTRHKAGRRRPYILPGAIALAFFTAAIFNPPFLNSHFFKFAYLLIIYILLNTALTVISVPHAALGGELSFNRNERTEIFGYKRGFDTLGALFGLTLPAIILSLIGQTNTPENVAQSRHLVGFVLTLPLIITAYITLRATRGHDKPAHQSVRIARMRDLIIAQWSTFKNPYFLPLISAFIIISIGRTLNASTALYYYEYRLLFTEQETVGKILFPFFIAFLIAIPFWVFLSRKKGKKWPAISGIFALGISGSLAYPLFPSGHILYPMLYAIPGGLFVGAIILLDALIPDVIDHDELKTRQNREGLYFGVWKMATKLARALGLILSGILLDIIGFDPTSTLQSPEVTFQLALIFGPVVGLFFLIGGTILIFFPLTDARHQRIQNLLQKRREKHTSTSNI